MMFLLIATALIVAWFYLTWDDNFWKKKKIPFVKPHLLFGSFKDVLAGTKHFGVVYADIYNKFRDAAYVGFFKIKTPGLVIRDPEIIKSILVKDFQHFAQNDFEVDPNLDRLIQANIFLQYGEEWRKNRSAWTTAMTSNKLKLMHDSTTNKCNDMIDFIKDKISDNPHQSFETRDLSINFLVDAMLASVFKLKSDCFYNKDNPFKTTAVLFSNPDTLESIRQLFMFVCPKISQKLRMTFVDKRVEKMLLNMGHDILKIRKTTGFDKNNAFDAVFQHKMIQDDDLNAAGILFNFISDATETSASMQAFAIYSLAAHPDIQTKLREELLENLDEDGKLTYDKMQNLSYLDMFLNENLRIYTPATFLTKKCTKAYTLPPVHQGSDPLTIEAGTPIIIPIYGLHMDPAYHPDPKKFSPERFSPENIKNMNKFTYLPFGEGPRACFGMRMALNQIKVCITGLLKHFELRLTPEMINRPIEIDPRVFVHKAVDDLWVTFHEIKKI